MEHAKVTALPIRHCPLLDRECMQHKCMLWVRYQKENKEIVETCALVMGAILQEQAVVEQIRTQAAVESFRNAQVDSQAHVVAALTALCRMAAAARSMGRALKRGQRRT